MSWYWENVVKYLEPFLVSAKVSLGNGSLCSFCKDRWCADSTITFSFLGLYELIEKKEVSVASSLSRESG